MDSKGNFENLEIEIDNQFSNYKHEILQEKPGEPDLPDDTEDNDAGNQGDGGSGGGFMINRRRQAPTVVGHAGSSSQSEAILRLAGKAAEEASPQQSLKLPPISDPQNKLSTAKVRNQ